MSNAASAGGKKSYGGHKPNTAKRKSRVTYNASLRDVSNKEKKLIKHKKAHPKDGVSVEKVMDKYFETRKKINKSK